MGVRKIFVGTVGADLSLRFAFVYAPSAVQKTKRIRHQPMNARPPLVQARITEADAACGRELAEKIRVQLRLHDPVPLATIGRLALRCYYEQTTRDRIRRGVVAANDLT